MQLNNATVNDLVYLIGEKEALILDLQKHIQNLRAALAQKESIIAKMSEEKKEEDGT